MTTDPRSLPAAVVLAGPTASGKTALAVELARALGAEVVSADSMLVYRHLDVGTAKPTPQERGGVPHHLIDIVDPDESYDASRYREDALGVLADLARRGRLALIAGGTGLYLRALRCGLAEAPGADPEFRRGFDEDAERLGAAAMHERLARVDPDSARAVHPNDLVRIQRALEIHHLTGRTASDVRREHGFRGSGLRTVMLVLDRPDDVLRARIRARARAMVEAGLLDEVRRVLEMGWGEDLRPLGALNYKHACEHLRGLYDLEEMMERMERDTWQFARRQRRWFRGEPDAVLVPPDAGAIRARIAESLASLE